MNEARTLPAANLDLLAGSRRSPMAVGMTFHIACVENSAVAFELLNLAGKRALVIDAAVAGHQHRDSVSARELIVQILFANFPAANFGLLQA